MLPVPFEYQPTDFILQTLRRALEVAFAPADELERGMALAVVGAVCEHPSEDTLAIVFGALRTNIAHDRTVANVLYELDIKCGTHSLRPAALIGLARHAYEAGSPITLASVLSNLANRPRRWSTSSGNGWLARSDRTVLRATTIALQRSRRCCRASWGPGIAGVR